MSQLAATRALYAVLVLDLAGNKLERVPSGLLNLNVLGAFKAERVGADEVDWTDGSHLAKLALGSLI